MAAVDGNAGTGTYVPSFPTLLAMRNLPEVRTRNPQRPHPSWLLYLSGTQSRHYHSALLRFLHVINSGWAYLVYLFVCLFTATALVQSRCSINISQMELMNEWCTRRKTSSRIITLETWWPGQDHTWRLVLRFSKTRFSVFLLSMLDLKDLWRHLLNIQIPRPFPWKFRSGRPG